MITDGFEDEKYYIDFKSTSRPYGNMREESEKRAVELYSSSQNLLLGLSGGLDSQTVLHSFVSQGIPIETVFFHSPGYNDNELKNVKFLDNKYGINTQVIDLDPVALRSEIEELTEKYNFPLKNNALQMKFLEQVPKHYDFIQMCLDPYVHIDRITQEFYYFQGYHSTMISRLRCFSYLNRTGKNIMYGWTPEFIASVITDDIYLGVLRAAKYFNGNGVEIPFKHPKSIDRWDMYIKPVMYGKYWGDELEYFSKYAGFEKLDWIRKAPGYKLNLRNHAVLIPYFKFIDFLNLGNGETKRFYEHAIIKKESD